MKPRSAIFAGCILFFFSALIPEATWALSIGDLSGTWRAIRFETPTPLQLYFDTNRYWLTDIGNKDNFSAFSGTLNVASNGTFVGDVGGPVNGTFSLGNQGVVNLSGVTTGGPVSYAMHINASADFLAGVFNDQWSQDILLAVKAPASATTTEMAGSWHITHLATPQKLIVMKSTNGAVVNVDGLDVFYSGDGVMNMDAAGNLSGSFGGPMTGTYSIGSLGQINAIINASGDSFPMTMFVNASKDIMLSITVSPTDNEQILDIFTKSPSALLANELTGAWKSVLFETPVAPSPIFDTNGMVTEISGKSNFRIERSWIAAGWDAYVTGYVDGIGAGTLLPNGPNAATLTFTNFMDEVTVATLNINAGKNTFVGILNDLQSRDLVIVTKAPTLLGPIQDFGLIIHQKENDVQLYWAGTNGTYLQSSSNLTSWIPYPGSTNQHSVTISTSSQTNQSRYYRVAQ